MRLEQIDHVALRCASPEASKAWYISTLGFEHVFRDRWSGVPIFMRLGTTYFALFPRNTGEPPAVKSLVSHIALRAATYDEFRSAWSELVKRGVPCEFGDHEISHSIYFSDPDGLELEITTYDVPNREGPLQNAQL